MIDLAGCFNSITNIFIEEPFKEIRPLGSSEIRLDHGHESINLCRFGQMREIRRAFEPYLEGHPLIWGEITEAVIALKGHWLIAGYNGGNGHWKGIIFSRAAGNRNQRQRCCIQINHQSRTGWQCRGRSLRMFGTTVIVQELSLCAVNFSEDASGFPSKLEVPGLLVLFKLSILTPAPALNSHREPGLPQPIELSIMTCPVPSAFVDE